MPAGTPIEGAQASLVSHHGRTSPLSTAIATPVHTQQKHRRGARLIPRVAPFPSRLPTQRTSSTSSFHYLGEVASILSPREAATRVIASRRSR